MEARSRFPTTRWTLVLDATDARAGRSALEQLCSDYWPPVYAFIRRQVRDGEEARDLTQAFFARLLEKGNLRSVRPERGRFRSYLLAAVKHFLSNERERQRAQKRGGGFKLVPLDEPDPDLPPREIPDNLTPERIFERRWALLLRQRALVALKQDYQLTGRLQEFEVLKEFVTDDPLESYRDAAEALGSTESAVKTAVHRLRRRFGEALRTQIAQTVADPEEVDEEIRYVLSMMGE
jgi:RNA polymerase sigma-70 factor (ECF subfamily)